MSDEPVELTCPWLDPEFVLGWQASLIASGADHDALVSELEVLLVIVRFCECGAVEDAPRADRLEECRTAGFLTEIDAAEDTYLRLRREQRKRLRESAQRLCHGLRQNSALP